jgi:hypothetical protein
MSLIFFVSLVIQKNMIIIIKYFKLLYLVRLLDVSESYFWNNFCFSL